MEISTAGRLFAFRVALGGISQAKAAILTGTPVRTWEGWENENRKPPSGLLRLLDYIERFGPLEDVSNAPSGSKALALPESLPTQSVSPISPDVVEEIALDIGKAVAQHIETMYPAAVEATTKNMLTSVRNCTYNEIMDSLKVIDESEIRARLRRRKETRRLTKAEWKRMRAL